MVAVGLGIEVMVQGGLFDFLAVFIEAGEEEDFFAEALVGACDDVGDDFLVGMAEVRLTVDVIDGGGDVEPFGHRGECDEG